MAESEHLPNPEVWAHLDDCLAEYRAGHEELLRQPESGEEESLHNAMDQIEESALSLLQTGAIPIDLGDRLSDYQPGSPVDNKVLDLLQYNVVQHRLEFDAADTVITKLKGFGDRLPIAIVAFALLLRSDPSESARKYLHRAATLFLCGYDSEVLIMCGAVLEAAMAARLPDEHLRRAGLKPAYNRTGVFSLGQRMSFEESQSFLDRSLRDEFWEVINWRNDAVHVQPDIGPKPALPLLYTAHLLGAILPRQRLV